MQALHGRQQPPGARKHDLAVVAALDTVKDHVTHVLGKLGAGNRGEVAGKARQPHLLPGHRLQLAASTFG